MMSYRKTLVGVVLGVIISVLGANSWAQTPTDFRTPLSVDSVSVELVKIYDKSSAARVLCNGVLLGVNDGDTVNVIANANFSHADADTGLTVDVNFVLGGPQKNLYRLDTVMTFYHGQILPKRVYLSDFDIDTVKIYDGEVLGPEVWFPGSLSGLIPGDNNVGVSLALSYDDPYVGVSKSLNIHPILSGRRSNNYYVQDTTVSASIIPRYLEVVGVSVDSTKEFDRTVDVRVSSRGTLVGCVSGDSIVCTSWAQYLDSTIGIGKRVVLHNQIDGERSGNYRLINETDTLFADITPRRLSVSDIRISSKIYDGGHSADVIDSGYLDLTKVLEGDSVSHRIDSVYFIDKSAGDVKAVYVSQSLVGTDSGLYMIDDTIVCSRILRKNLSVSGVSVNLAKEYDGESVAEVINVGVLSGLADGDTVELSAEAFYTQSDADTSLDIIVEFNLSGPQSDCYSIDTSVVFSNASISPRELFLVDFQMDSVKVYDGTVNAPTIRNNGHLSGIVQMDAVDSISARFRDENVGVRKMVDVKVYFNPIYSNNYFVRDTILYATILPRVVEVDSAVVEVCKEYDKSKIAVVLSVGNLVGVLANDTVIHYVTARYLDSLVGENKPIIVDYQLLGVDMGNYQLSKVQDTLLGAIIKRRLSLTGIQALDKEYDGNTTVALLSDGYLNAARIVAGDTVYHSVDSAYFLSKMADTNNLVKVEVSLHGSGCENYSLLDTVVRARVFRKKLHVAGMSAESKVYDGTMGAVVNGGSLIGVVGSDDVTSRSFALFDNPDAGSDKSVFVKYSIVGADTSNYQLSSIRDTLFSNIYPKSVHVDNTTTRISQTKVYDKSDVCEVLSPGILTGVCARDYGNVAILCTASYDDVNVGDWIRVKCTYVLTGNRSGNYLISDSCYKYASITPLQMVVAGAEVALVKEYDGNDVALVRQNDTLVNLIDGDDVSMVTWAKYQNAKAGSNKIITLYHAISGGDSRNYYNPIDSQYSDKGKIVEPTEFAEFETSGNLYQLSSSAFCQGDTCVLDYKISKGEPVMIKIVYSEAAQSRGFSNTSWMPIPEDSTISLVIPMQVLGGKFSFRIDFQNEAEKIASITDIPLVVNLSNRYLRQTFEDVISIDNSGRLDGVPNRFQHFLWFHNGDSIVGVDRPYIRERGGLTGEYSVLVRDSSDDSSAVCPIREFIAPSTKAIIALPNVVRSSTQIRLQGFENYKEHTLQVFDFNGVLVNTVSFTGLDVVVDCSYLSKGSYLLYVDGVSTKIVKQ